MTIETAISDIGEIVRERMLPTDQQSNTTIADRLSARSQIMEMDGDYVMAALLHEAAGRLRGRTPVKPA